VRDASEELALERGGTGRDRVGNNLVMDYFLRAVLLPLVPAISSDS
jgi:hypothetical protein